MTTHELIEHALLDAHGLLDEQEREQFELAFRAAAPAIKDQIFAEQRRWAASQVLLPDVTPDRDLRDRVLAAVRVAMAEQAGTPEPMAMSGVVADWHHRRRVAPLWRAAAIGCAAATLVLAATTLTMLGSMQNMERLFQENRLPDTLVQAFGPDVRDALFNEHIRHVLLKPAVEGFAGEAVALIDPRSGEGWLVCQKLPTVTVGEYRAVVIDESGAIVQDLGALNNNGQFMGVRVNLQTASNLRLAVTAPDPLNPSGPGRVVLATAKIA